MMPKPIVLVLVLISMTASIPVEHSTTPRSPTQIGETIKQLTNQLMDVNATSPDVITLDTRTPPKIKEHVVKKKKNNKQPENVENSHAGIAIPIIDEDVMNVDNESTKKLNFYKIERQTTNSGLSTWILLNQQTTKRAPFNRSSSTTEEQNSVVTVTEPSKIPKPIFKKRTTTTTTTSKPKTTESTTTTTTTKHSTKLTRIKASLLTTALNRKKSSVTTTKPSTSKGIEKSSLSTSTFRPNISGTINKTNNTSKIIDKKTTKNANSTTVASSPSSMPVEAKDGEVDLKDDNKKTTNRVSGKKKKNKTRRRRPADKLETNGTKIVKHIRKQKPIGTQLYNYLSREIMPTVGVGLVGLMVTAGLASYFLYPLSVARRSYDIDRRDKDAVYYHNNDYSSGIAEEEAIGKVIAGMPTNSFNTNYKSPTSRFVNVRNRHVENFATIEPIRNYAAPHHTNDIIEQNKETGYTVDGEQFVVGNIPKEMTPVSVPEHGPRSLRVRRGAAPKDIDDKENEIGETDSGGGGGGVEATSIQPGVHPTPVSTTTKKPDKIVSFFDLLKDLLHLKINLSLQIVQNATQSVSKYISKVQARLNEHYRNYTINRQH